MRFIGTNCSRCRFCSGVRTFSISVSIGPGCTEFTRILRGARSIAAALVIPLNAHLVAPYASAPGDPRRPATDDILAIAPPPDCSINGTTVFMPRKQRSNLEDRNFYYGLRW